MGACISLTESAWLMRSSQSLCYRTGRFLFLEEETTSVLLMLTFMTLALQTTKMTEVLKTVMPGGGDFSKRKLSFTRVNKVGNVTALKWSLKTFKKQTRSCSLRHTRHPFKRRWEVPQSN